MDSYILPAARAPRVMAAVLPPPGDPSWRKRYAQKGRTVPEEAYDVLFPLILDYADSPRSLGEIREELDLPDGLVKPLLNWMASEGKLLRVGSENLRSNTIRYVAARARAKDFILPTAQAERDVALQHLARAYLRAFGPARIRDFQWWAGVTVTRARAAVASLDTVAVADEYLLLSDDLKEFEQFRQPRKDVLDILPQWDSYLMGYAPDGRERLVDPEIQTEVYNAIGATGGNAMGTVMLNGEVYGVWRPQFKGTRLNISLRMFDVLPSEWHEKMYDGFRSIAGLLDAENLVLKESGV